MGCDLVNVEGSTAQGNTHIFLQAVSTLLNTISLFQNSRSLHAVRSPDTSTPWRDIYNGTDMAERFYVQLPVRNLKLDSSDKNVHVNANGGNDIVEGSDHHNGDFLFGERGDDIINGKGGDDVIDGGPGTDRISGGRGADIFWISRGFDTVTDFNYEEGDLISLHRARGKVYVSQIGGDTYLTTEILEAVMRLMGSNASEVYNAVMGSNHQLEAVNFLPALNPD